MMLDIAKRSEEINRLVNSFWRAVSLHVDSQTERSQAVEQFKTLVSYIRDNDDVGIKTAFTKARRHIRYSVNESEQVFQNRYSLPPKIFHMGQAIAHYTEVKNLL